VFEYEQKNDHFFSLFPVAAMLFYPFLQDISMAKKYRVIEKDGRDLKPLYIKKY